MTKITLSAAVIGFVIILAVGTNIVEAEDKDLFEATFYNDLGTVKFLLETGADVNAKDKDGKTPLMFAFGRANDLEIANRLLDKGADVNARDKDGKTVLILASRRSPNAVKLLIDKGADVNARDNNGTTALMDTTIHDVAELLIDRGADVNARDNNGRTALMKCPYDLAVLKLLLAKGADVNAKDNNGKTALMEALEKHYMQGVRLLLDNGADVNAKDKNGKTALMMGSNDPELVNLFLIKERSLILRTGTTRKTDGGCGEIEIRATCHTLS